MTMLGFWITLAVATSPLGPPLGRGEAQVLPRAMLLGADAEAVFATLLSRVDDVVRCVGVASPTQPLVLDLAVEVQVKPSQGRIPATLEVSVAETPFPQGVPACVERELLQVRLPPLSSAHPSRLVWTWRVAWTPEPRASGRTIILTVPAFSDGVQSRPERRIPVTVPPTRTDAACAQEARERCDQVETCKVWTKPEVRGRSITGPSHFRCVARSGDDVEARAIARALCIETGGFWRPVSAGKQGSCECPPAPDAAGAFLYGRRTRLVDGYGCLDAQAECIVRGSSWIAARESTPDEVARGVAWCGTSTGWVSSSDAGGQVCADGWKIQGRCQPTFSAEEWAALCKDRDASMCDRSHDCQSVWFLLPPVAGAPASSSLAQPVRVFQGCVPMGIGESAEGAPTP